MQARVYLDHNATTPLDPRVARVMAEALAVFGNPSSIHTEGRQARDRVESARQQVAQLVSADPMQIVFTSGGTEADALGMTSLYHQQVLRGRPRHVVIGATEHPAVIGVADGLARQTGAEISRLAVNDRGQHDLEQLAGHLERGAALVAVMLANHELGTVSDIAAISAMCRAAETALFCDAVQAAGRHAIDVEGLGVDGLAISGHKIYGPKGAGALWLGPSWQVHAIHDGGHQERGRRPGTENTLGVVGMGEAARLLGESLEADRAHLAELGRAVERGLAAMDGVRVHGADAERVPGVVHFAFEGVPGELLVQAADLAGFALSTGAACTSGTVAASPVLLALGQDRHRALEGIRLSLGRDNRMADVKAFLEQLPSIVARIREFA